MKPSRKQPRDFVSIDELWEADPHWDNYFIDNKVWVFVDEYHAQLTGDEDYCRIIIHSDAAKGWLFTRPLKEKTQLQTTLAAIEKPVSKQQLETLGFVPWDEVYI